MDRLGDHGKVEKLILILILCNFVFLKSCGEKWNHTSNSGTSLKIELYTFVLSKFVDRRRMFFAQDFSFSCFSFRIIDSGEFGILVDLGLLFDKVARRKNSVRMCIPGWREHSTGPRRSSPCIV